jgi:subtilisin family serine protease
MRPAISVLGPLTVLAVVGGLVVVPAQAAPSTTSTPQPPAAPVSASVPAWTERDGSVDESPSVIASGVGANERERIVTVRTSGSRPTIEVDAVRGRADAVAAIRRAQRDPAVLSVGLDTKVSLVDPSDSPVRTSAAPSNDQFRSLQWALDRFDAEAVWETSDGTGVTVAVIDTGTDGNHPDLAGQVLDGIDYIDSGNGWDDGDGHGTHVGGIIAATADNGIGVAGLAPGAAVLPVRALDDLGVGFASDIAAGIIWSTNQGADVINLSLGSYGPDTSMTSAVNYAISQDVVVVAASGNDGDPPLDSEILPNQTSWPAADTGVIGVGATTKLEGIASFSTSNATVDLSAPGVDIGSTYVFGPSDYGYGAMDGTSMATPFVAAAAAILRSAAPGLSGAAVGDILADTAIDRGAPGRDDEFGAGRLDVGAALCVVEGCSAVPPAPTVKASAAFAVSSPSKAVKYGGGATIAATLRVGGVPRPNAPLAVYLTTTSGRAVYAARTDAYGRFVYRPPSLRGSILFQFVYGGSATSNTAYGATRLSVRPGVRVVKKKNRTLKVRIAGAAKQKVTLQRRKGATWVKVKRRPAKATMAFRSLPPRTYRVKVAPGAGLVGWTSPRRTLR